MIRTKSYVDLWVDETDEPGVNRYTWDEPATDITCSEEELIDDLTHVLNEKGDSRWDYVKIQYWYDYENCDYAIRVWFDIY